MPEVFIAKDSGQDARRMEDIARITVFKIVGADKGKNLRITAISKGGSWYASY